MEEWFTTSNDFSTFSGKPTFCGARKEHTPETRSRVSTSFTALVDFQPFPIRKDLGRKHPVETLPFMKYIDGHQVSCSNTSPSSKNP